MRFDGQGITAGTGLILSPASPLPPASLFTPTPEAARRVLEFFTAQINNDHTRRAYLNAARRFDAWCDARGIAQLTDVQAFHVAAFIKDLQGRVLAALPAPKAHQMWFCGFPQNRDVPTWRFFKGQCSRRVGSPRFFRS
jgi:hypothetical protein